MQGLSRLSLAAYVLFAAGTAIIAFAWFASYPVTIPLPGVYVFDLISPSFWVGLAMVLASLVLISESSRSRRVKLFCAISLVFFLFSYHLFFERLFGSDAHYFRALTSLSQTVGFSPAQADYFQWPSFFVLNDIVVTVTGLDVNNTSKLMFVAIGIALSSILFLYYSDDSKGGGFVGVALYFAGLFWFLDYQFAPQSIALVLLLVCVKLATRDDLGSKMCNLLVFVSLTFMHAFMPALFLIFYLIIVLLSKKGFQTFLLCSAIYVARVAYLAVNNLQHLIVVFTIALSELALSPDYENLLLATSKIGTGPIDTVAQIFSRGITVSIWLCLLVGLLIRVARKDFGIRNLSLMLSGFVYAAIGIVTFILGNRGFQISFVPFASSSKPFQAKYRKFAIGFLLIALTLFPFVIIHQIYATTLFQSASGERADEALINTVSTGHFSILASREDGCYMYGRMSIGQSTGLTLVPLLSPINTLDPLLLRDYNYVVYGYSLDTRSTYVPGMSHFSDYGRVWDDGSTAILSAGSTAPSFQYFPTC